MFQLAKTHPRYPKYKPTNIDWIGDIPNGWEVRRIKTFSQVRRGASPRPIDDPKYFDEQGEYSWVRIADVSASDRYLLEAPQKLSALGQSLSVQIEPGELFVSIAGTVGKPIISGIKCCIHDGFVYFNNLEYNKELLYWIFIGGEAYKGLGKLGTQLNLNTETIGNIAVPFPSKDKQGLIVNYLDEKTALIDEAIAKKQHQIELLSEHRTALINNAITKGLDPNAEMKDSGTPWIGMIPKGWEVKKLRHIAKIHTGDCDTQDSVDEGIYPFFVRSDIVERINSYSFDGEAILTAGDGVGVGKVFHYFNGKFAFHQRVYAISDLKGVIGKYLYYFIRDNFYKEVMKLSAKSTVDSLRRPMFLNFPVCFPGLNEQQEIIKYLDSETAYIDAMKEKIQQSIGLLQEYKTSLISHVVSGKIKVS